MNMLKISHTISIILILCYVSGCKKTNPEINQKTSHEKKAWISLFDGKTLNGWKSTEFGGQGDLSVDQKNITISSGVGLSGITWQKDFPKSNFEIALEFKKTDGDDFACALTFPVKKSHCSFICGGWGGAAIGLSSIDRFDASENQTSELFEFNTNTWYRLRVRVTDYKIMVWINDELVTDFFIENHLITTRPEIDLAKPLGISTFQTGARYRKIRYRKIPKPTTKPINPDDL